MTHTRRPQSADAACFFMSTTYQLGLYANGIGGLRDMVTITGVDPHPTEFLEYGDASAQALSGRPIESGFARSKWTWGELEQWAFDALYTLCTGASADVLIRTRVNSGTPYSFGIFRGIMTRPRAQTAPGNRRTQVEVVFINLRSP